MKPFEVPIVLFLYKRLDTVLTIIDRLRIIKAAKIYLIGDTGKNANDIANIEEQRSKIEEYIDWECIVIKNYAELNRGVYENIALGAKWVFEREEIAIFLEDDNLPELTFFNYCRDLLYLYQEDTRILWICGTNYLGEFEPEDGSSYMFTRHLLPCGWASWAPKFLSFYDFNFDKLNAANINRVKDMYEDKKLFAQQYRSWLKEKSRKNAGYKYISWDFHMSWSIRVNNLWGISPKYNQIKNIGVDEFSEHGGSSLSSTMTKRFCGMNSFRIEGELIHPDALLPDTVYEKKISNIILYPFRLRAWIRIGQIIRVLFKIPNHLSVKDYWSEKSLFHLLRPIKRP